MIGSWMIFLEGFVQFTEWHLSAAIVTVCAVSKKKIKIKKAEKKDRTVKE